MGLSETMKALSDPAQARVNETAMAQWRAGIRDWLEEAHRQDDGQTTDAAAEALLNFLLGAQVAAVFDPRFNSANQLVAQLDGQLARLRG